jgi:hypothetical protein
MTLDLVKVSAQLQEMGADLHARGQEIRRQKERAQAAFFRSADQWERLAQSARASDRSAAAPLGPLDEVATAPERLVAYQVLATDGSTIEPDRHGPAMCALVNIGRVRIRYGYQPFAELSARPDLIHRQDDLYIEQSGRRLLLRERLLDARRSLMEMQALSDMCADTQADGLPCVALADGLLTIWRDDWATPEGAAVVQQFSDALRRIADLGLPLAAYISSPSSHWVVDLLRGAVSCGDHCTAGCSGSDPCAFKGPADVDLYDHLRPGERSGVFEVVGRDQVLYDEAVRSHFFYLNVGREIVRIEVPAWVARNDVSLSLVHRVIMDQADRGQGYPSALARAHEQAVLSGRDRVAFQQLVAEALTRAGLGVEVSEKQASKNRRAV